MAFMRRENKMLYRGLLLGLVGLLGVALMAPAGEIYKVTSHDGDKNDHL